MGDQIKLSAAQVKSSLKKLEDKDKALFLSRYFKTAPGEYGHGDKFLGIKVPESRKIARSSRNLSLPEIQKLLDSKYHEQRLVGLFILVLKFDQASDKEQKSIYHFYVKNLNNVNNWDLVDSSAPQIVGRFLLNKDKAILYKWASSKNLWKRRVSILSTLHFIREKKYRDALNIGEVLLDDSEDLIHKGVGWMLREIGNRDIKKEEMFLKKHYQKMPRTMLRYAIEKFPEKKRKDYLLGRI
ncbi:MAG: DNA alkylation repair protein [Bacteriovoracaceae bacterium]|jgi:3-methyladenine DNA glycosylase AlkD|nr:DNA alkylation repair protein [Bacteriovoracaceae bacterium]